MILRKEGGDAERIFEKLKSRVSVELGSELDEDSSNFWRVLESFLDFFSMQDHNNSSDKEKRQANDIVVKDKTIQRLNKRLKELEAKIEKNTTK